ncbi:P-loop containing nucleoside triphosphate hydrolase protein [Stereum hirsutum FP-91666 SS1]|uniref:p-loop containing nucleoside triphosphate hydrolase protein n=1 Tax=Stereum hirsutum (strain FP-91666) TaxID=721885 RepID=R7RXG5_STEHR|nr:P-loop containing nucleoside triphosphate hydrolase protein [Stereum hirsutum FP-91666 SS1]EIM80091.1 P-loop containing nucleoside triphosphate hydrolase protein [Stereum hirsutum FP-91666 SS1]
MEVFKSLVQPFVGNVASNSVVDGMKLVVLGGTVETARRVSSSAWSSFVNSFFLTAHFSEEDYPYDWLMLWLSRRPEWQRSREFETTTSSSSQGQYGYRGGENAFGEEDGEEEDAPGKARVRVVFQPTMDTTHTIFYRGHWLRVKRGRKGHYSGYDTLSISVVARNNSVLKQLVLQAKKEYEAEAVHRIQIYFADSYGSWRWTDSRHKRPMSSIVLNPGVKEMLVADTHDFLRSEKWYADRGIPFRRGYLLYGVPGSGKSSLIHAIAGELLLDIYVVSLSSSWINDSTLTTLMGRVPSRCIVLLEDLDAAFTRSLTRSDKKSDKSGEKDKEKKGSDNEEEDSGSSHRHRRRHKENISDTNTLTLSGLLNALDGVAASEGRILFATTNHLERLDPALCRPGRMDVWVEFKNASRWQAEHLFRNFFPSSDADLPSNNPSTINLEAEANKLELEGLDIPNTPASPASSTFSSLFSDAFTGISSLSGSGSPSIPSSSPSSSPSRAGRSRTASTATPPKTNEKTESHLPPAVEEHIAACSHSAPPLSGARLAELAKQFAEALPDEEFSVAALQGYLLKNKSRPEAAASEAAAWVVTERALKEKMKKEKEVKEKERKAREEREEKEEQEKKEKEAAAVAAAAILAAAQTAQAVVSPSSSSETAVVEVVNDENTPPAPATTATEPAQVPPSESSSSAASSAPSESVTSAEPETESSSDEEGESEHGWVAATPATWGEPPLD